MSRIPPELARRVDRLARRAHAFHRWAHHPLCSWYAGDVIRLGRRVRVCLGCTLTGAGAITGIALGLAVPALPGPALLLAGGILLAAVPTVVRAAWAVRAPLRQAQGSARPEWMGAASGRVPPPPGPLSPSEPRGARAKTRTRKLLTRLVPSAAAGLLVAQEGHAPSPARLLAAALAALAVAWVTVRYRHRGPDRSACAACPRGPPGVSCPGLRPLASRERAFSRLAGRWIAAREAGGGAAHGSGPARGAALPVPAPDPPAAIAPPRPSPPAPPVLPPPPPVPSRP